MEIKELIKHCKKGNQIAQGVLYNAYYNKMYNLSMRMLANHHDVEDVLIIAFTRIFNNIGKLMYQGDNSFNKWIKTITINESIRFLNTKKQIIFDNDMLDSKDQIIKEEFETDLIDKELVFNIIEHMPDGYRVVFNLFALEGYNHKEIAEMLGISENTSKSQLRKARIHIIDKIEKHRIYGRA